VGDKVTFRVGKREREAKVVEDRGPLGVGGKRVMRVALIGSHPSEDTIEFELAEDLLKVVARAKAKSQS
jgi:hypothetical protein